MLGPDGKWSVLGAVIGVLPGRRGSHQLFCRLRCGEEDIEAPRTFRQGCHRRGDGAGNANNAAATSSFIPLLNLGIPGIHPSP